MPTRRLVALALATTFVAAPLAAKAQAKQAGAAKADVAATIHKLEQVYIDSRVHGDTAALRKLLADDYVAVGRTGDVTDKAAVLKAPDKNPLGEKFTAMEHGAVTVRVAGSTAVATGRRKVTTEKSVMTLQFTHVFVERGGSWQLMSSQVTEVK